MDGNLVEPCGHCLEKEKKATDDLNFLREIKIHLENGLKNDPEEIKYGLKMVSDWIDELAAYELDLGAGRPSGANREEG